MREYPGHPRAITETGRAGDVKGKALLLFEIGPGLVSQENDAFGKIYRHGFAKN
jgi:hypothetical protein